MNTFKNVLATLVALLASVVGILLLWGFTESYFLDEQEQTAIIPGLPSAWEGERFALIADWQVGMWLTNVPTIRRAVSLLVRERPAFVLIAGDFVYHTAMGDVEEPQKAARLIRPLAEAGIPTYAVLGNHDYGMQKPEGVPDEALARRVTAALEAVGVYVLENEAVALPLPDAPLESSTTSEHRVSSKPEQTLYLVGIGPSWPERAKPRKALAQVPRGAPRLVLMHNPNAFAHLPTGTAPVAMAGHTHGGQVRLPFTPHTTWMTYFRADAVHADGWITTSRYEHGTNRLYVNRGIGFSLVPLRINAMPELTRFTLQTP